MTTLCWVCHLGPMSAMFLTLLMPHFQAKRIAANGCPGGLHSLLFHVVLESGQTQQPESTSLYPPSHLLLWRLKNIQKVSDRSEFLKQISQSGVDQVSVHCITYIKYTQYDFRAVLYQHLASSADQVCFLADPAVRKCCDIFPRVSNQASKTCTLPPVNQSIDT